MRSCRRFSRRRRFRNILGEVVAHAERTQLRMAETEKYPHVTYFLNGGREECYPGEDRIMVPSPEGRDLRPAAGNVGARTDRQGGRGDPLRQIRPDRPELRQSRHGGPHRQSCQPRSRRWRRWTRASGASPTPYEKAGGALLVTADHGNCELMRDPATGGPHTAHTTNPVPLVLTAPATGPCWRRDGSPISPRPCSS